MKTSWNDFIANQTLNNLPGASENKPQLIALPSMGLLRISGEENKKFLQGQLTCDLNNVNPSTSCLGTYCNLKGRAISSFRVFQRNDDIYLLMDKALLSKVMKTLQKYIVFSKAEMHIMDESNPDVVTFALTGDNHQQTLAEQLDSNISTTDFNQNQVCTVDDLQIIFHQSSIALIVCSADTAKNSWNKLATVSQTMNQNAWDLLHINAGVAQITEAASELFIPLELHLQDQGFINFEKGCYTGQEIIARLHYRGKLKQSAFVCTIEGETAPACNTPIVAETNGVFETIGQVVNAAKSDKNTAQLLAIIKHEKINIENIRVNDNKGPKITVSQTPYAIPK